ncbi:hypothetical protein [uncultured Vibrio sp.]|uniref:hypothetical protein n=1 Tax=uncultured Vibrio sp. TaxID=114054 RepID=UPI00261AA21F|nr:hypothetical protein [uncultured Vibrio sp.]
MSRLGVNKNSDDIFNEEFLKRINKAPLWVNILGKDSIENKDSNGIIRNLCERIEEINAIYINDSSSMVLINYDEFIKNKFETVKNLFINLDIDIKSEKAIKDNVDQQFQRKGQSNSTECFYSEAHMEIINEKSHNYRKILNETRG